MNSTWKWWPISRQLRMLVQLAVMIFFMIGSASKFQSSTTTTLPFNEDGYMAGCPPQSAPFKKFLWLFFDGLATDQGEPVRNVFLENSPQHTTWFKFFNSGMANSANVYTSYFSGKSLGNIVGNFIESDTIFRSMKRADYSMAYLGWSTPLIEMLNPAPEVFDFFKDYGFSMSVMPELFGELDDGFSKEQIYEFLNTNIKQKDYSALVITGITDKMNHWHTKKGANVVKMVNKLATDIAVVKQWIEEEANEYLLVISSDHGGDTFIGESVTQLHGPKDGGNEPFVLFYNPKLESVSDGVLLDVTDFTPTFTQYFQGVNIPAENVGQVFPWAPNDETKAWASACNAAQLNQLIEAREIEKSEKLKSLYEKGVESLKNGQYRESLEAIAEFNNQAHFILDGFRDPYLVQYLIQLGIAGWAFFVIYFRYIVNLSDVKVNVNLLRLLWDVFWMYPLPLAAMWFAIIISMLMPIFDHEKLTTHYLACSMLFFVSLLIVQNSDDKGGALRASKFINGPLILIGALAVLTLLISGMVHFVRLIVCRNLLYQLLQYFLLLFYVYYDQKLINSRVPYPSCKPANSRRLLMSLGSSALLLLLHLFETSLGLENSLYIAYHICFVWIAGSLFCNYLAKATLMYPVGFLMYALELECYPASYTVFVVFPSLYALGTIVLPPEKSPPSIANSEDEMIMPSPRFAHRSLLTLLVVCAIYAFVFFNYLYIGQTMSLDLNPDIPGITDQVAMYMRAGVLMGFHKAGIIIFAVMALYRFVLLNFSDLAPEDPNPLMLRIDSAPPAVWCFNLSKNLDLIWQFAVGCSFFYIALFEKNFYYHRHTASYFTLAMIHATMAITFAVLIIPFFKILPKRFH